MAFVVKKKIAGKEYYYLQESTREGSRVKSKCLGYLGKTKIQADKKAKEIIKNMKKNKENMDKENTLKLKHVEISIEELTNFCKRKGFVFRSSDIYGGFSGFWDFAPLGAELFNNLKKNWWDFFVHKNDNMVGIDASIISHPRTWKASGHITSFKDLAVICKKCKKPNKLEVNEFGKVKCDCGGDYEKTGEFNMLFETDVGALDKNKAYLRGETAQGMFMNFKLIQETMRMKLPFGIAQIGRCFRNEIAPRDFLFRLREFHIGEFEFFLHPDAEKCNNLTDKHLTLKFRLLDAETQEAGSEELKETTIKKMLEQTKLSEWHAFWLAEQIMWFYSLGLTKIKIREHKADERSHYSSATFDVDYEYPFGSKEVAGNANRGQYDLTQHIKESKKDLSIFDETSKKKIIPKVIEPTFGMERVFLAILVNSYYKDEKENIILKLPPKLAPIKAAVFPIVKQPEFEKIAKEIVSDLKKEYNVVYDQSGSIGKRYARNDEIGTPYCITIDGDSLKNKDVTIRWRDTTKQIRIKISELKKVLKKLIDEEIEFEKAGKIIK
ncbi:MAG: glycine--tRNA ligase [Nanoarchaeota archaeon]|nr:glycine--tRNA ligase [Nanoarchaeota archaeon]MBU4117123.1 glycine--tRNA ligase [Nanoarchaeota archaeon]